MTALEMLTERLGEELVAEMFGEWLGKHHRARPRLLFDRPESPARAPHYLAFVRELPCCVGGCGAPSDAHHYGPRGVGQKTDDYRTAPVCRWHHGLEHGGARCVGDPEIIDTLVRYLRVVEQT